MTTPRDQAARNRIVALAAMTQCAHLVRGIARKGGADAGEIRTVVGSLFVHGLDAERAYGGLTGVRTGLFLFSRLLRRESVEGTRELLTYTAAMIVLEHKLSRRNEMVQQLAEGMRRIEKQIEYFGDVMHESVIAAIAELYGNTVSTLKPRILVRGKPDHLRRSENTRLVRALLLAGIHAAHLWRKNGGSRLHLLWGRRRLGVNALALLREVSTA